MQLFVVGGAVRDRLLGLPVQDRDWVAVGATPEELLAQGYRPVGKDFPVFLHPTTGEEVALARTERKSGRGYHGFTFHAAPGVTLQEDLARRDLTINAMAEAADGTLIDPFGGRRDLAAGVLRHVSPAFAEDPVRLLRLARFAARLPRFSVAPETAALLRHLVDAGEVDALVPERVWQELARGLMAARPSRMFEVLRHCGALPRLMPEPALDAAALARLDGAAAVTEAGEAPATELAVRFALLGWPDEGAVHRAAARLRLPIDVRDVALLVAREAPAVEQAVQAVQTAQAVQEAVAASRAPAADEAASTVLTLLERCDALRRPERFGTVLRACGFLAGDPVPGRATTALQPLLAAALAADTATAAAAAARDGARGPAVGEAVRAARRAAVAAALQGPSTAAPTAPAAAPTR